MKSRNTQYLPAALLAAILLLPAPAAGEEAGKSDAGVPSPTPSSSPPPTPRAVSLALYFRRPARIVPIYREEGAAVIPREDFEICDETPWLTEAHLGWISYLPEDNPRFLRLHLNPRGNSNFREAMMGNVGRTILLVIDGTVRSAVQMVPLARKDQIDFPGEFSAGELNQLLAQIQYRTTPSPPPTPSPTPVPKKRFIVR